jgi:hypothetical protein
MNAPSVCEDARAETAFPAGTINGKEITFAPPNHAIRAFREVMQIKCSREEPWPCLESGMSLEKKETDSHRNPAYSAIFTIRSERKTERCINIFAPVRPRRRLNIAN